MRIDVNFLAAFGDIDKRVSIHEANGGGGGSCQLMIDNRYYGQFVKYNGLWEYRPQSAKCEFTRDDVDAMIERIEASEQTLV